MNVGECGGHSSAQDASQAEKQRAKPKERHKEIVANGTECLRSMKQLPKG